MYACRRPFLVVQDLSDHHDSLSIRVDNFYLEFCSLLWQSHPPPCRSRPPRPMCMIHHFRTWTRPQGGKIHRKIRRKVWTRTKTSAIYSWIQDFADLSSPTCTSFCSACKIGLLGVGLTDTWTRAKCETKYTVGGRFQSNLTKSSESDSSRKLCITYVDRSVRGFLLSTQYLGKT